MFEWFKNREKKLKKCHKGVPELKVEELRMSHERGLQISLSHPLFSKLTDELCMMFEESGAINFVEYQIYSEKYGMMAVNIQRVEGETPAAQNVRLKAKIVEMEKTIRVLSERLDEKNGCTQSEGKEVY